MASCRVMAAVRETQICLDEIHNYLGRVESCLGRAGKALASAARNSQLDEGEDALRFSVAFFIEDPAPLSAMRLARRVVELLRAMRGIELDVWHTDLDARFDRWIADLRAIPRAPPF